MGWCWLVGGWTAFIFEAHCVKWGLLLHTFELSLNWPVPVYWCVACTGTRLVSFFAQRPLHGFVQTFTQLRTLQTLRLLHIYPCPGKPCTSVHKHSHTHLLPCLWNLDIVSTTMFYINKQTGFVLSVDSLLARETRFVVQQFAAGALSTKSCSEVMGWVQTRLSFTILRAKNVIKGEEMGHARKMGQGSP